jgi:hypothetical protein
LLISNEYFQHVGNTNQRWAASLYKNLGLASIDSPTEEATLTTVVLNGYINARQNAAALLAGSTEHKARLVASYYKAYLGRSPNAAETASWVGAMQAGLSDESLIAMFMSSPEFTPLTGSGSSNAAWMDKVYQALLFRTAVGDSTASSYINQLNNTPASQLASARQSIALQVLTGSECRFNLVASFYNKYLKRNKAIPQSTSNPDGELSGWVSLLAGGATQEQVNAMLLSSAEYFTDPHTFP